jgi:hypothetical protein
MDCPNCGAYNASNSVRCRRCNQLLPTSSDDRQDESFDQPGTDDRGWDSGSLDTAWDIPPDDRQSRRADEPEGWPASEQPSDWGQSSEAQWQQQDPWQTQQLPGSGTTSPGYEQPGAPGMSTGFGPATDLPNYLWQSIAVTLCCCWPLGIPAIVYASRVNAFKASGNFKDAQETSDKAKMWTIIALAAGLLAYVAFICIAIAGESGM